MYAYGPDFWTVRKMYKCICIWEILYFHNYNVIQNLVLSNK